MYRERKDPRFTQEAKLKIVKEQPAKPHPALDALFAGQQSEKQGNSVISLPKDYIGPALLTSKEGNFPINIVTYWAHKDETDQRPHVSVMVIINGKEHRVEGAIPAEWVTIDLPALRQFKAKQKRLKREERNKSLSSRN